MDGNQVLLLGLGIEVPWKLVDQHLDTDKTPHELHLEVKAKQGAKYPCPVCGKACSIHDFQEKNLAAPELLPASLLYPCLSTACEVSGTRCQTD